MLTITDHEYQLIRELVYRRFGINLGTQKKSLVVSRLRKILIKENFSSFKAFYDHVINDRSCQGLSKLVDRISTNHTYFFREDDHFTFLSDEFLPQVTRILEQKKQLDIRIWCAGCSSGEEPYTLAVVLNEFFKKTAIKWNVNILATDISGNALAAAEQGVYSSLGVDKIPVLLRNKYFNKRADGQWEAAPQLKDLILFRRLNLMREQYPFKRKFHLIFCRNVMIYFDEPTRTALVKRFYQYTAPDGYLFIGHSESLRKNDCPYQYVRPAIYQRS